VTEKLKAQPDSFANLRTPTEEDFFVPWESWRKNILGFFPDTSIPLDVEPHLEEWYVLRNRTRTEQIAVEEFKELQVKFSDEHPQLFDNPINIQVIRSITERFPIAV